MTNPKHDRSHANDRTPTGSGARGRRFRIEKLEERIAPKKGGKGTNNCGGGTSLSASSY